MNAVCLHQAMLLEQWITVIAITESLKITKDKEVNV